MNLKFSDINVFLGRSTSHPTYKPAVTAEQLLKKLDSLGIKRALAWHISQYDHSPQDGNRLLSSLITPTKRLLGCWTILPPQTREMLSGKDFFAAMKKERIFALRAFPDEQRFLLNRVTFGKWMDEIAERKIPLLLSLNRRGIDWNETYSLLADYPKLTCVICETGTWGSDRKFRPLIEKYENVRVETSMLSLSDGVIEQLVKDYGSKRFLFGSGFPDKFPEAAMLQLKHAGITDKAKQEIASENFDALITAVEL
jgi:uncharacterized protein